jgi:CheY-like chemotaxis protein
MAKIMLVEDDNNLREIYEARLLAEGYEIVSAHDGEEALALAVKEKPDLIISDVMMPKISGFDMLDILRSTPETKDTKVIMMTALSQAEDKSRADKLGADRYLVKSQVTLEDVAKIAREVLEGSGVAPAAAPAAPAPVAPVPEPTAAVVTPVVAEPVVAPPTPAPVVVDPVTPPTSTLDGVQNAQTVASEQSAVDDQVKQFVSQTPGTDVSTAPAPAIPPAVDSTATASPASDDNSPTNIAGKKVLQPISDPSTKPDLNKLLQQEAMKNPLGGNVISPSASQSPAAPDTPKDQDPNLIAL